MEDSEVTEQVECFDRGWEERPTGMRHGRSTGSLPPPSGRFPEALIQEERSGRRFDLEYLWPRKRSAAEEKPVAVVLRGLPAPLNWGWFSREDQRMHLQTVNKENQSAQTAYKAWLEDSGSWRVIWDKKLPHAKDVKAVEKAIQENREVIEAAWAAFMIEKGWLTTHVNGQTIVVVAYPEVAGKFQRTIDLAKAFPGATATPTDADVGLDAENASVVVWKKRPLARQQHVPLVGLLWK